MAGDDLPRLHKASWTFRPAECYPRESAHAYPPPPCLSLACLPAPLALISHATRPEEKKLGLGRFSTPPDRDNRAFGTI